MVSRASQLHGDLVGDVHRDGLSHPAPVASILEAILGRFVIEWKWSLRIDLTRPNLVT